MLEIEVCVSCWLSVRGHEDTPALHFPCGAYRQLDDFFFLYRVFTLYVSISKIVFQVSYGGTHLQTNPMFETEAGGSL